MRQMQRTGSQVSTWQDGAGEGHAPPTPATLAGSNIGIYACRLSVHLWPVCTSPKGMVNASALIEVMVVVTKESIVIVILLAVTLVLDESNVMLFRLTCQGRQAVASLQQRVVMQQRGVISSC